MKFNFLHIIMAVPLVISSPAMAGDYAEGQTLNPPQKQILRSQETRFNDDLKVAAKTPYTTVDRIATSTGGIGGAAGAASGFIDVRARFVPAAFVEFKHDTFFAPDFDEVLLKSQSYFKNTEVKVHGIPGETAVVSCEIQYMEVETIKSYTPVETELCDTSIIKQKILATMGGTYENQVKLSENQVETAQYDSYVALEITYL